MRSSLSRETGPIGRIPGREGGETEFTYGLTTPEFCGWFLSLLTQCRELWSYPLRTNCSVDRLVKHHPSEG